MQLKDVLHFFVFGLCAGAGALIAQPERAAVLDRVDAQMGLAAWSTTEVLQAEILASFGGSELFAGTMTFETNGPRARLDHFEGPSVVYDGATAWISPAASTLHNPRFQVLTWYWFLAMPFKLRVPGSELGTLESVTSQGESFLRVRQTWAADQGDSPDDWYLFYIDPETHLIRGAGYVVTFGQEPGAEPEPSAIVYRRWINLQGVRLPQRFVFTDFTEAEGFGTGVKGQVELRNLRFVPADTVRFDAPEGAKELTL